MYQISSLLFRGVSCFWDSEVYTILPYSSYSK